MLRDFTTAVTGWLFLAGARMLWGGGVLRSRRVGMFFRSDDFPAAGTRLHQWLWLWLYRVHLFGVVVSALVALAALLARGKGGKGGKGSFLNAVKLSCMFHC